jgi:1-aminocyclopropane-1-carboxylate deaminase/D-cysteine desulfhydrase-like pyridoxal-dependent ACC family enzyme
MTSPLRAARERLEAIPSIRLGHLPTPVDELARLRETLGFGARLFAKRDDALPFGFGGNKVRKLTLVAARAVADGADTLITCGGIQSNHCRASAATAARLGLRCCIVANGEPSEDLRGNALLSTLYGAEISFVTTREDREPAMERLAAELRALGRHPVIIPLGASTPLGAMAIARGVGELVTQGVVPDVIVHATSSGGTQAGLIAGCALYETRTRVIGVSADDPADGIRSTVITLVAGVEAELGLSSGALGAAQRCEVDDTVIGDGYGIPSESSIEAQSLAASTEALVTDHWYTAKAMASLIERGRRGEFPDGTSVLFWHTGGQPGVLA